MDILFYHNDTSFSPSLVNRILKDSRLSIGNMMGLRNYIVYRVGLPLQNPVYFEEIIEGK